MERPSHRRARRHSPPQAAAALTPLCDLATEHVAVLRPAGHFPVLRRRDDLLDEGVHAVFGLDGDDAALQAVCFRPDLFNPAAACRWNLTWRPPSRIARH